MSRKQKQSVPDQDNPQWTVADFARARRPEKVLSKKALEVFKPLRGRPKLASPKQAIKLRLDADVLAAYRKTGDGWQTRINDDLRKARKLKVG